MIKRPRAQRRTYDSMSYGLLKKKGAGFIDGTQASMLRRLAGTPHPYISRVSNVTTRRRCDATRFSVQILRSQIRLLEETLETLRRWAFGISHENSELPRNCHIRKIVAQLDGTTLKSPFSAASSKTSRIEREQQYPPENSLTATGDDGTPRTR